LEQALQRAKLELEQVQEAIQSDEEEIKNKAATARKNAEEEAASMAQAIIEEATKRSQAIMADSAAATQDKIRGGRAMDTQEAWRHSDAVVQCVLQYIADQPAPCHGGMHGFLLYGARAVNCYITEVGLQLETKDYDFKVLHASLLEFTEALERLVTVAREGCTGIDVSLVSSAVGIMHLQVNALRVIDFSFMPPFEYEDIHAKYGPPRLAAPYSDPSDPLSPGGNRESACIVPVLPFRQMKDHLTQMSENDSVPKWRREKGARQLQRMDIAMRMNKITDRRLAASQSGLNAK